MKKGETFGYKENPKTMGSGIICSIPQTGLCPNKCEDCFFQGGRSYLEPLERNLPNVPTQAQVGFRIVRINDGNDSNVQRPLVISSSDFPMKFYNTAIPKDLEGFDAPVVLTVNPGKKTDETFYKIASISPNLMFVRFRVNMWNLDLCDEVIDYYSSKERPIILTFMAYFTTQIKTGFESFYKFRKRTLNPYWAITTAGWEKAMERYKYNKWVYSCGKIEGELGITLCRFCGNCLREYFATRERMEAYS